MSGYTAYFSQRPLQGFHSQHSSEHLEQGQADDSVTPQPSPAHPKALPERHGSFIFEQLSEVCQCIGPRQVGGHLGD